MRAEIIETIKLVALKYVHFEHRPPLVKLMEDLVQSRNWKQMFGSLQQPSPYVNQFLQALAKEYKENSKGQQQKLLIGNTKAKSKIAMFGDTPLDVSSRVEAAKKIGRVQHYGDEKRRLLSIVAYDYPYSFLQSLFQCSPNTITAARFHSILFGRGGVPPSDFKFSRQRVSPKILEELTEFLNRDDIARASSCRGVLVDGKETAVRYWQDSIKNIVQQYHLENPNGIKRTYIYTHLHQNFRSNTMLAGLCNLCDDFGHSNFDEMCKLVQEITHLGDGESNSFDPTSLAKELRNYQAFLKTKYSKLVEWHSTCLELCLNHAFGTCSEEHPDSLQEVTQFYQACDKLSTSLQNSANSIARDKLEKKLAESISTQWSYVSHLILF